MDLPLPPLPAVGGGPADGLYTIEELLGGWRADDPHSFARTHDAQTYRQAVGEGLRVPRSAAAAQHRALHDHSVTRALYAAIDGRQVVAFMGGHRLRRDSATYRLVADISRRLTRAGYLVVTGGGPGAMEAGHLGALLTEHSDDDLDDALRILGAVPEFPHYQGWAMLGPGGDFVGETLALLHAWQVPAFAVHDRWGTDRIASIGVPTWLYGHEPPTPLASLHAKYFENSIREDGLLAIAKAGVIYAEGSAGTLQEVFQDAAQNHYASVDNTRSPMVFLDIDEFWSVRRPVRPLLDGMFDEATERLISFVTTADEAVAAITGRPT